MKALIITLMILFSTGYTQAADTTEIIAETTKNAIKFGKNLMKGINDGVNKGRSEAGGVDGAIVVTNADEMEKHVTIEILSVQSKNSDTETHITVGFKNNEERPVRIANMDDKGIVLLIDNDGYSTELSRGSRYQAELTIPPRTGKKHNFIFNTNIKKAKAVRLWNKEFELINSTEESSKKDKNKV